MWFVILWLILGAILVVNAFIRRSWITGQTAFTGVWFASLTALWAYPSSWNYISGEAVVIIVSAHTIFFLYSLVTSMGPARDPDFCKVRGCSSRPKLIAPTRNARRALFQIFWTFISIGIVGSWLAVLATGAFEAFQEGTLILTRGLLLTGEIEIPVYQRFMSNLLYPASLLGAICFLVSKRSWLSWSYVLFPLAGILLYSFAFGGRGAILIGGSLMVWVLAINRKTVSRTRVKNWKGLAIVICIVSIVFLYLALISAIRRTDPSGINIVESLYQYFVGPIPAFGEWLTFKPLPVFNTDFSNLAFIRELLRFRGVEVERAFEFDIAYVPFITNVFTHLAEHIRYFGIVGALAVSAVLGILSAMVERKPLSVSVMGIRATIYTYLSFTLFADLSFLAVGWWLTLLTIVFIVPLYRKSVSATIFFLSQLPHHEIAGGGEMG